MKNILVIGSKGFIGLHVFNYFMNKPNINVWGCDVMVDYVADNYYLIDSINSNYHSIFSQNDFDLCINCSGAASVPNSLENPLRDFTLNSMNVYKILDAIRRFVPSCKFINLSSAAVYGNPESLPIVENQSLNPVSPYGYHKLMAERICKEFSYFYEIKTCSLRIFSAYGDGLKKQLFWDLYHKSTNNKISLYGTGMESRDFIHVYDILQVIDVVYENFSFDGTAINVANGKEISIRDVVNLFYSNFDKYIDVSFSGTERKGDPSNWVANIDKLIELGYKQTVSLETGLANYYRWIEDRK